MTDLPSADDESPDLPNRPLRVLRAMDHYAKPDLKRAIPAGIIALVAFALGESLGGVARATPGDFNFFGHHFVVQPGYVRVIVVLLALVFALAGVVATRSIGNELARVIRNRANASAASAIRLICFIVGYGAVGLALLSLLRVDLSSLLIGGAVTGIVVGIAAQQTLANFFAGLVLLFARPYVAGERIRIRTGALGGPFDGVIIAAGLMYTIIHTDEGPVSLPNAGLLAAAIGPAPEPSGSPEAEDGPAASERPDSSAPPGTTPAV